MKVLLRRSRSPIEHACSQNTLGTGGGSEACNFSSARIWGVGHAAGNIDAEANYYENNVVRIIWRNSGWILRHHLLERTTFARNLGAKS